MTTTLHPDSLTERMAALERKNRGLQRAIGGLTVAFVAAVSSAFAAGHPPPTGGELKAQRFTLVDGEGNTRGVWQAAGEPELPSLVMYDQTDQARVEVSVGPVEALCVLRDLQGKNRVGMAVDAFPHFMMHDAGQKPRVHMSVGQSGAPSLLFIHEDGTFPAGMGAKGDGSPWLKPDGLMDSLKSGK